MIVLCFLNQNYVVYIPIVGINRIYLFEQVLGFFGNISELK